MKDPLKQLMAETGLGSAPCSIALEESKGDYAAAKDLLAKHGAKLAVDVINRRRAEHEERRKKLEEATTEEERPHHTESASSLQPKEWCPLYQSRSTTNEAAEIGTLQHYAAETGDMSGLDEMQASRVMMALNFVTQRFNEIKAKYPDATIQNEVYGNIDDVEWPTMNERSTSGGFVDVVITFDSGRRVEIWDYKFGQWAVEDPENNLQGIVYVLNHHKRHPNLEYARVGFIMPYLEKITFHDFNAVDFERLYVRVKRLVALRQSGKNLEPNMCFTTCMWCAKLAECPAVQKAVYKAAKKFAPLKVPEDPDYQTVKITSENISAWIQYGDVCKAYGESIRQRFTENVVEHPELCPESHTLIRQEQREVADREKFDAYLQSAGIPESTMNRLRHITITDATKALKDLAPRGEKEKYAQLVLDKAKEAGILRNGPPKIYLRANRSQ